MGKKSLLQMEKGLVRTLAKGALYGVGGVAIGWPLIEFGNNWLIKGWPARDAMINATLIGTGYNMSTNSIEGTRVGTAVMRTGIGAAAILIARKL